MMPENKVSNVSLTWYLINNPIVIATSFYVSNKVDTGNHFFVIAKLTIFNSFTDIFVYLLANLIKLLDKSF